VTVLVGVLARRGATLTCGGVDTRSRLANASVQSQHSAAKFSAATVLSASPLPSLTAITLRRRPRHRPRRRPRPGQQVRTATPAHAFADPQPLVAGAAAAAAGGWGLQPPSTSTSPWAARKQQELRAAPSLADRAVPPRSSRHMQAHRHGHAFIDGEDWPKCWQV
jgi:hypothetical protein